MPATTIESGHTRRILSTMLDGLESERQTWRDRIIPDESHNSTHSGDVTALSLNSRYKFTDWQITRDQIYRLIAFIAEYLNPRKGQSKGLNDVVAQRCIQGRAAAVGKALVTRTFHTKPRKFNGIQ